MLLAKNKWKVLSDTYGATWKEFSGATWKTFGVNWEKIDNRNKPVGAIHEKAVILQITSSLKLLFTTITK